MDEKAFFSVHPSSISYGAKSVFPVHPPSISYGVNAAQLCCFTLANSPCPLLAQSQCLQVVLPTTIVVVPWPL